MSARLPFTDGSDAALASTVPPEAPSQCQLCPRLVAYRDDNQKAEPFWFNGAVPSFGAPTAKFLIVGLAPGRSGANRTGRPFTGDYAGVLLYDTLLKYGFASGHYGAAPDDGVVLVDCMISNAVRCAPPENKPSPTEIATCRAFVAARIAHLPRLQTILALGRIAHDQVLAALGLRKALHPFAHGTRHDLGPGLGHQLGHGLVLFDSFHCSRYNTNTGRLTVDMFEAVFAAIREEQKRR